MKVLHLYLSEHGANFSKCKLEVPCNHIDFLNMTFRKLVAGLLHPQYSYIIRKIGTFSG